MKLKTIIIKTAFLLLITNGVNSQVQTLNKQLIKFINDWGYFENYYEPLYSGKLGADSTFCEYVAQIINGDIYRPDDLVTFLSNKQNNQVIRPKIKHDHFNLIGLDNNLITSLSINGALDSKNNRVVYDSINTTLSIKSSLNYNAVLPSIAQRVLTFSKIWNTYKFYYPYREILPNNLSYNHLLGAYLTETFECKTVLQYNLLVQKFISEYHDSHSSAESFILRNEFGVRTIPAKAKMIENHFVIADDYDSTLFESSQLKKGDIILKIKSESIRDLRQRLKKFIPASNKASFYRDLIKLALRTNKTEMPMVIKRDGQVIELVVKTFPILDLNHLEVRNKSGLSIKPINDSTLYVNFKYADTIKLREAILCNQRLKYFIFDLRSSTKWLVTTLSEFLVKNKNPYAVYYMPLMNKPGYFSEPEILYSEPQKTNHLIQDPRIYILVNENTQSQGEFQTMYLQSIPGSKTIGTKTAGTDGNTFEFKIPGNITIRMTFLGVLYPNFQQTQTNGVNIDHYSPIKIIDFKQGKDPSLNLVMDLIKKGGY